MNVYIKSFFHFIFSRKIFSLFSQWKINWNVLDSSGLFSSDPVVQHGWFISTYVAQYNVQITSFVFYLKTMVSSMAPRHCTTWLIINTSTFSSRRLLGSSLPTLLMASCSAVIFSSSSSRALSWFFVNISPTVSWLSPQWSLKRIHWIFSIWGESKGVTHYAAMSQLSLVFPNLKGNHCTVLINLFLGRKQLSRWISGEPKRWIGLSPTNQRIWTGLSPKSLRRWTSLSPKSLRRWTSLSPKSLRRWTSLSPKSLRSWTSLPLKRAQPWTGLSPMSGWAKMRKSLQERLKKNIIKSWFW